MSTKTWTILEPISIGGFTCKNRVIMAAHSYGYTDRFGLPTQKLLDYLEERARGGVGMLIMGGTSVSSPESALEGSYISVDDRVIPWYEKISKRIHKYGTLILDQLMHAGGYLDPNEGAATFAPSTIPEEITCSIPVELNKDQIESIIDDFVKAGIRCKIGGLDGIELKCCQGLLLHQFLSPYFNRRNDEYGGSLENRIRIIHRILVGIRDAVGKNFILGVRISGDSMNPNDLTQDDGIEISKYLSKLNILDYIHVNGATNATFRGYWLNHGDSSIPLRNFSHLSREIKKVTSIPIISSSMIMTPEDAEHLVSSGSADLVAMTRSQIADPEIIKKITEGREDEIRPCVLSNQGCIGNHWKGRGVHCIHNVSAGREKEFGVRTIKKAKEPKKILVVGGGVAGLEFARVAAMRGHNIELFEKNGSLGGQLLLATQMPYRHNFVGIINYLENQIKKLKVSVHKGVNITAADLMSVKADYDLVVLAAGAQLYIPPNYDKLDSENVFTIKDMLLNEEHIGTNVLVLDIDWRQNSLSIAEWLLQKNKTVTIMTPTYSIGANLDVVTRTSYYSRVYGRAQFMPLANLVSFQNHQITYRNVLTNKLDVLPQIDSVVFVTGSQPETKLFDELKPIYGDTINRIGDCVIPNGIPEAMLDANKLARSI